MLDILIRGGSLVDGSGAPARRTDVGIAEGRIQQVGDLGAAEAREAVDATGLVLCPGFVDPHTHYDAQLLWDPLASPSNQHGVTTIVGGNCGFSLAPLVPSDADYLRRMMAVVEGMPLDALEQGIRWDWESFGDYLSRFDGGLGVNAAFLVGHCALRRAVMGADAVGKTATSEQIDAMAALLHRSIEGGGLGFSTSLAFTHTDGDGQPVPSRWASEEEVLALCAAVGEHEGTTLEFIIDGCLQGFSDDEIDLVSRMSLAAQRVANWNVLSIDSKSEERYRRQIDACERAAERGARIVALTMPVQVDLCMSFLTHCAFNSMPGWGEILSLPLEARMQALRDPEVRRGMDERARSPEAGVFAGLSHWGHYRIGNTFSPANAGLDGRRVGEIAEERGQTTFDTLVEIALCDELRTVLWPGARGNDDASWALRVEAWQHRHVTLGGSDAGAHLDRMCGAPYTTAFLADCLRGRQLITVEQAVAAMTDAPARLFGLRNRGRLADGYFADIVVFDPATVGPGEIRMVDDLPGGSTRLFADAAGIDHVLVNGRAIVENGAPTSELPGTILHAGRDTKTVEIPGRPGAS